MRSLSLLIPLYVGFAIFSMSTAHGDQGGCSPTGYRNFEQAQKDAERLRKQFDRLATIEASRAAWCLAVQEFGERDERALEARLRLSLALSDLYRFAEARREAEAVTPLEPAQNEKSFLQQLKLAALGKADALSLWQGKAEWELEASRKLALNLKQDGARFSIDYAAPLAYIYWLNPPNTEISGLREDCRESLNHEQLSAQEQIVCESEKLQPASDDDAQRLSYDGWLRAYAEAARSDFDDATRELTSLLAKYDAKEGKDYVVAPDNPVRILTLGMLLDNQRRRPIVEAALKDLLEDKRTKDFGRFLKTNHCMNSLWNNSIIQEWQRQSDVANLIVGAMHNDQIRGFIIKHRGLLPAKLNPPFSDALLDAALQSPPDLSQFVGIPLPDQEDAATTKLFSNHEIVNCILEIANAPETQIFISSPELSNSDLTEFLDTIFHIIKLYANIHHGGDSQTDIAGELIGAYVFGTAVDYAGCSYCSEYIFEKLAKGVDQYFVTGNNYNPLSQIVFARLASYSALRGNYDKAFEWFQKYDATVEPWADEELQNTLQSRRAYDFQGSRGALIDYLVQLALKAPPDKSARAVNLAADALLEWRSALEFEQAVADKLNSNPKKPETLQRNGLAHRLALTYSTLLAQKALSPEPQQAPEPQQIVSVLIDEIGKYNEELDEINTAARIELSNEPQKKITAGEALQRLSEIEVANQSPGSLSELTGLSGRTAYVQFRAFWPLDFDFNKTGEADHWAALVLKPNQAPRIIKLATIEETKAAIDRVRGQTSQQEGCIGNPDDESAQTDLFNKLIQPLESAIGDADVIYVVAPNELQWVSFEWLRTGGHVWGQTPPKMIRYLAAPTSLRRQTGGSNSVDEGNKLEFLTVGAENYGGDQARCVVSAVQTCPKCLQCTKPKSGTNENFCDANATAELSRIRANIKRASKIPFYLSPEETNNSSKTELLQHIEDRPNSIAVAHISTHGFYYAPPDKVFNPLLFSGIALSNANVKPSSDDLKLDDQGDRNDNILRSVEIENLPLKGAVLVTLSACNTASGEVDPAEGVLGPTRALLVAGAKNILTTRAEICSGAALNLFPQFYELWGALGWDMDPAIALYLFRNASVQANSSTCESSASYWSPYLLLEN